MSTTNPQKANIKYFSSFKAKSQIIKRLIKLYLIRAQILPNLIHISVQYPLPKSQKLFILVIVKNLIYA